MYVHIRTCTQIFIAILFMITKTWQQLRCASVDEWINCVTSRQCDITQHEKEMNY